MNRRSFFQRLAMAGAAFSILPPATTYSRIWRAARAPVAPVWVDALGLYWTKEAAIKYSDWADLVGVPCAPSLGTYSNYPAEWLVDARYSRELYYETLAKSG